MAKDLIVRSSSAEFLIFERQTHDKGIQVRFEDGDLWLTQKAISELYNCSIDNVSLHLKNIYNDFELDKNLTAEKFSIVQKVTDIYATSVDYDKKSPITIKFFKKLQNKMYFAVSKQTAVEII